MSMSETVHILEALEKLRDACYKNSVDHGFWDEKPMSLARDGYTGPIPIEVKTKPWNMGEKIALIHSELSEMLEAWRKDIGDSEKEIRILTGGGVDRHGYPATRRITAMEEEVADVFIRLMDLCGKLNIDVGRVVLAKMAYNESRPYMHGRKC